MNAFLDKLQRLLEHSTVQGEIVDLDSSPSLRNLYQEWDASSRQLNSAKAAGRGVNTIAELERDNVNKANSVAVGIKTLIASQRDTIRNESVEYLIFLGSDSIIPQYRLPDQSRAAYHESNYAGKLPDTSYRIGAALSSNHILMDDFYSDSTPKTNPSLRRGILSPGS